MTRASWRQVSRRAGVVAALAVVAAGCASARYQTHAHPRRAFALPEHPRAWPFAAGTNLLQVRLEALRTQAAAHPALGDRTLLVKLVRRIPGFELLAGECGVGDQTRLRRAFLELEPFDRLSRGAVIAVQGTLDVPRLIACLARTPTLGLRRASLGPYPGVVGAFKGQPAVVFALARDTVVAAVGTGVARVRAVVAGKRECLAGADEALHLGSGKDPAVLTFTVSRFVARRLSLLTSPLLWFVRMLRSGTVQVWAPELKRLRVAAVLTTRGPLVALRLKLRWKVLRALVSAVSKDAATLLSAATMTQHGRALRLRVEAVRKHREALFRLVETLLTRLKKRKQRARRPAPRRP